MPGGEEASEKIIKWKGQWTCVDLSDGCSASPHATSRALSHFSAKVVPFTATVHFLVYIAGSMQVLVFWKLH